jgi:hypothetical protein
MKGESVRLRLLEEIQDSERVGGSFGPRKVP